MNKAGSNEEKSPDAVLPAAHFDKIVQSARTFAPAASVLDTRREILCGYGGDSSTKHVAVHIRAGDLGADSETAPTTMLGAAGLVAWLCKLTSVLGLEQSEQILVHIYTESPAQSRAGLRKYGIRGLRFPVEDADDQVPVYHTKALLDPSPACPAVKPEVHLAVNGNPREALLCMARADVLVTSFSTMSWSSALLNEGLVFHPDERYASSGRSYVELRDSYLDWAPNWFRMKDVDGPNTKRLLKYI